jgi:crotonobetainyl-CoA:carnitine CoA-transferase CaiB-like acyl-CoA transferase
MHSLGIGYKQLSQLNPGLIYVAISPFGHFTSKAEEFRNVPDTDLTAQAESGYPAIHGDPKAPEPYNYPLRAGMWAAWYMAAGLSVAGTLVALYHKRKTGEGQMIDIATNDAITTWMAHSIIWGFTMEMPRVRLGSFDWCLYPYGYFKCKDGYVTIATSRDEDFRGLLKILGRWDLEDDWKYMLDRITDDIDRLEILGAELDKELAKYTRDELVKKALDYSAKASRDRLRAKGLPIIVKTLTPSEVLKEQHWKVRNTLIEVNHPTHGKFILPASVPKMSKTPPRIKQIKCGIGEDNEFIYKKYGLRT